MQGERTFFIQPLTNNTRPEEVETLSWHASSEQIEMVNAESESSVNPEYLRILVFFVLDSRYSTSQYSGSGMQTESTISVQALAERLAGRRRSSCYWEHLEVDYCKSEINVGILRPSGIWKFFQKCNVPFISDVNRHAKCGLFSGLAVGRSVWRERGSARKLYCLLAP
jgi:hypothetical protein